MYVAGAVVIIVLPALMRWLNKKKPEPGLAHVAVPFSLGLFLDAAQLAAYLFFPQLPSALG